MDLAGLKSIFPNQPNPTSRFCLQFHCGPHPVVPGQWDGAKRSSWYQQNFARSEGELVPKLNEDLREAEDLIFQDLRMERLVNKCEYHTESQDEASDRLVNFTPNHKKQVEYHTVREYLRQSQTEFSDPGG